MLLAALSLINSKQLSSKNLLRDNGDPDAQDVIDAQLEAKMKASIENTMKEDARILDPGAFTEHSHPPSKTSNTQISSQDESADDPTDEID